MPAKRRAGPRGQTSCVRLVIKVTPEERLMIATAANHDGVSVSEYVRESTLERVRELLLTPPGSSSR